MKLIGAFDAKTHLSRLLAEVARGEHFIITKHGNPIAELKPIEKNKNYEWEKEKRFLAELRAKAKVSIEEIIAWKNEGRK